LSQIELFPIAVVDMDMHNIAIATYTNISLYFAILAQASPLFVIMDIPGCAFSFCRR